MPLTLEQANSMLPEEPTQSVLDPAKFKYFVIGPPKFGKTTLGCMIPDSLLLAFEEGHAFTTTHKIIIDQWDRPMVEKEQGIGIDDDGNKHMSLVEAVAAIVVSDRFQHIIIDTADMAARMCSDYHCAKLRVSHPSEAGDFGKGYDLTLTAPFRRLFGQIIKSGRGITFISHSKLVTRKVGNVEVSKYESTLPSQAQAFIHSQCDLIFHGKFGVHRRGMDYRDRIICTDGSDQMMAGSRVRFDNHDWPTPKNFILDPENGWEQWCSFFPQPNPDYNEDATPDDPASQPWLLTPEEAQLNCEAASQAYDEFVLGKRAKERDREIIETSQPAFVGEASAQQAARLAPFPDTFDESPAPTVAETKPPEESVDQTPEHLATPTRVKRVKPVKPD